MAFLRQSLLIWFVLVLGGGSLFASTRESRAYAAALADAQDQMWSRAETEFGQFVVKFPNSTNAPMAVLLEAQAQFQQGKYDEAVNLLSDSNRLAQAQTAAIADQYVRWTGEALFAAGHYQAAADTFTQAAKDYPQSPVALGMVVSAAAAYEKLGQWAQLDALLEATNGIFQRTVRLDPDNRQVAGGRLLLVRSKSAQTNFPAALAILNQLNPHTLTPEQEGNRSQQLYGVMIAMGNDDGALSATTNLMRLKDPVLRAAGVAAHATLLEKSGLLPEAGVAWTENLAAGVPLEKQHQAILKIAELAAAQNDFTNAAAALDAFLAQSPDSPLAELALLTSGEMTLKGFVASGLADRSALAAAQAKFDQLLNVSTNSPLAGKAYLDRGWCRWLAGMYPGSAADFQSAARTSLPVTDLAVATFKLGDALFAQGDYTAARNSYGQVLSSPFSSVPEVMKSLEQRALYQILRADLELRDQAGAETALRGLLEKYPGGEDAAPGLLLAGEGFSDFGAPKPARAALQKFETQFPDSPLKPEVAFAVARTFEDEQDWPAAVAQHRAWLKDYPTNSLLPKVQFALGRANFQAGNEVGAFAVFANFVTRFPTNELAPLAQWWVAEHFFRTGEWAGAETNYEAVFQNPSPVWRTNALVFPARLMAGRAAFGRQGYQDAVGYFSALLAYTNCPPDLAVQARFANGAALMNLDSTDTNNPFANVQAATNMYSQIIQMYPTNQSGARAWGELGDCDQLLGDYDGATNAYAQVINSDAAETTIRNAAQVGLGMALEKKAKLATGDAQTNLLQMALDNYLDVLGEQTADEFWVKKAGLQAAGVAETLGKTADAIKIYRRLGRDLPQLADAMAKKIDAANTPPPLK